MKNKIVNWIINHNSNIFIIGAVTLLFPRYFVKKCLENKFSKNRLWNKKNSCLTISFDCDYSRDVEAIPLILKMLKKFDVKASFACVGYWIEKYPEIHKMILEYGHEILNHTYSHPDNDELTPGRKFKEIKYNEKKEEIEKCHKICKRLLNYEPIGCRIPHFKNLFTGDIYGILSELGYKYSSSTLLTNTKSFGTPFMTKEGIYEFPLSTCPKHPFTVFDTWHSFNSPKWYYKIGHRTEKEYIDLFKFLIDIAIETNSYINIYIDPYDITKMKRFEENLDYLIQKEKLIWIATYEEIINELKKEDVLK